ncbi:hypothetical protein DFH09DRAFT_48459 [Mycena vulgaris]|nr:hypothetical protein DFH09DRAFT_48459 [Mycena vulgaris]
MCWALKSWMSNTHLLGGFVDAQTTEAMEDVLVKIRHPICITAPYHVREGHVDERDVFDAREADYLPAIAGYLYWQTLLPPD